MKRRIPLTLIAVVLFSHQASLQQGKGAALITEASIRAHMEFLAGDAMKGRGSGTEDEWRAAAYIGSQMRRMGIEPLGDNGGFVKQIETGRLQVSTAPVLTNENIWKMLGMKRSTIEKKISSDAPLPMPRSVICSPSHITNSAPVVRNSTIWKMKPEPGLTTAPCTPDVKSA